MASVLDEPQAATPAVTATGTIPVLHLINGEHYSGAERVQDLLALSLGECGFRVAFACLKPQRFVDVRRSQEAELFDVRMGSKFDLTPVGRVARLVKRHRFALVHAHTPRAAMIGRMASALTGVPLVYHLHSPTLSDSTRTHQNRFNAAVERLSVTGASAVIAVSHSLGAYARQRGIRPERIHVVPNGVPVQGPLAAREAPSSDWTLGTVALFRPRKGLEVLLESLAILRAKGLAVRLRAVGAFETADYERQIKSEAERLELTGVIDWIGFTRDVSAELARMDLFVLPSLFGEGLPMVVLEAMAAGVPVVATRVEGVPEAIRDGLEGLLVDPGDPLDLAQVLAAVIMGDEDWTAIRERAHRRQAEEFSDRSMARGVAEVYRQVLAP